MSLRSYENPCDCVSIRAEVDLPMDVYTKDVVCKEHSTKTGEESAISARRCGSIAISSASATDAKLGTQKAEKDSFSQESHEGRGKPAKFM